MSMTIFREHVNRYGIAVLTTVGATALRIELNPVLHDRNPFGLYFLSVIITAWLGGVGPAIAALILGTIAAAHFIILPGNSLLVDDVADVFALAIYFVVGAVAIALFHKLTEERRRFEQQLKINEELSSRLSDADKKKDEFMALLAHELRNPLAPIRTSLELLDRADIGQEQLAQVRKTIRRQLNQLIRIVDDLLDVSRFLRGQMRIVKEPVDLRTVIETAVETARPLMRERDHSIHVWVPREAVWVIGDNLRLTQVLSNLLTNACKYTPRGGRIQIAIEQQGCNATVEVIDDGIGIPKEAQVGIFETFTQVNTCRAQEQAGLGLGLAIVRQITELHGGQVSVFSDGPGCGSRFTVALPLAENVVPADDCDRLNEESASEAIPSGKRVLIVDDNMDAAETLAALFTFDGWCTSIAHEGGAAMEQVDVMEPDVILLDIGLPGMDGWEVARKIRARKLAKEPLIVAISGWGGESVAQQTLDAGMDYHFVKPVDVSQLQAVLARRLTGKAAAVSGALD